MKPVLHLLFFVILVNTTKAQSNYAVNFNGSAIMNCGTNAAYNLTGKAITAEAWIYPTSFATNYWDGTIIGKDGLTSTGFVLRCGETGKLSFVIAVTGNTWKEVVSSAVLTLNTWQHVAGTYDGTSLKLYVNGILVQTTAETASMVADAAIPLYIGYSPGGWVTPRTFTGKIDEVRIWNVSRTSGEIRANMSKNVSGQTGLVISYQMNDGSGLSVTDNSGNSHVATLGTGTSWVASPIQFTANALSFDGADDFVEIYDTALLDITTAITLEAWVYPISNAGVQNVICKSSQTINTGYIFPRTDDGWANTSFYLHLDGGWNVVTAAYPSLNEWHHLAATYDGATMKIYIDGVLSASQAATGTITTNNNSLVLGDQPGYSEVYGGAADDIRVWNTARTAAEIMNGMSRELNPSTASGLVTYFTMNQGISSGTNTGLTTVIDQMGNQNGVLNNFSLSGASSNYVAQNAGLTILPLQWSSFSALFANKAVTLNWSIVQDLPVQQFDIEHSLNGERWNVLGQQRYFAGQAGRYTHMNPEPGVHFYRIKSVNSAGEVNYSSVKRVFVDERKPALTIYPNPAVQGYFFIQMEQPGSVELYNQEGRMVKTLLLEAGLQKVNISSLPSGIYQLVSKKDGSSGKLVIQ